ncbi:MAG: helix-turn-helix domain-containing protein, partial [Chloroflexota bacterium]
PEGVRVPLNMTQEEIAEAIGASRETVSRLMADFKRRRLIRTKGGSVFLLQPDNLRTLSAS